MDAARGCDCIFLGGGFGAGAETGLGPFDVFLKFSILVLFIFS